MSRIVVLSVKIKDNEIILQCLSIQYDSLNTISYLRNAWKTNIVHTYIYIYIKPSASIKLYINLSFYHRTYLLKQQ